MYAIMITCLMLLLGPSDRFVAPRGGCVEINQEVKRYYFLWFIENQFRWVGSVWWLLAVCPDEASMKIKRKFLWPSRSSLYCNRVLSERMLENFRLMWPANIINASYPVFDKCLFDIVLPFFFFFS